MAAMAQETPVNMEAATENNLNQPISKSFSACPKHVLIIPSLAVS
jgi:hypothetical protein